MPFFKTSDGLNLYYSDTGAGLPLLCLAGLTRDSRDFRYFAPHAARCRMVTLDARGRGRSDRDPDFMTYNVLREAQDVLELLDHLGLGQTAILGTSRGGLVAMTLAAMAKDRLQAVILNDIGPEIAADGITRIMDYVGRRPSAKTHAQAAEALQAVMSPAFPDVPMARWLEEAQTFYKQEADGLLLSYDPRLRDALLAQAEAGPAPDLWPLFMSLDGLPCGVIRGANSDLLSQATYQEMQQRLPVIQAVEIANRGHVPFLDEPDALALFHSVLEQIQ
ncbi:hydrolase [Leisingera sp. ANG-M1]|uniref:alpha/beta fold hydrolase n=1 Tax=Leisingera sp. ANG-M1 TaxID=1577895 RepID=UPI00057E88ED|nr:alpha/beta hydrolase [Leisingera sp. ANG-M1]KIC12562.1 hydrolase [Leisingera sp. ANG-M1]